jgi:hypothetical protein
VDRYAKEVRNTVIVCRYGDRLPVRRPCRRTLQVERISYNPKIRSIGLHHA